MDPDILCRMDTEDAESVKNACDINNTDSTDSTDDTGSCSCYVIHLEIQCLRTQLETEQRIVNRLSEELRQEKEHVRKLELVLGAFGVTVSRQSSEFADKIMKIVERS